MGTLVLDFFTETRRRRDGSVARERGRLPIVAAGARGVSHLASSATLYVRRALAEDEGNTAWAAARRWRGGGDAMDAYAPGELASSPFRDRVEVFLTKNVGRFMDVDESLIARHVEREDETSALVTAEWYANGPYAGGRDRTG